jgi:hypothetical protein
MTGAIYQNFVNEYFDPLTRSFTFDLEIVDFRVILTTPKYHPLVSLQKVRSDIDRYEIKRQKVKFEITGLNENDDFILYHGPPTDDDGNIIGPDPVHWTETAPNGYHKGGMYAGPLFIKRKVRTYIGEDLEIIAKFDVTELHSETKMLTWGVRTDADPHQSTLHVGGMVYYINKNDKEQSPLVAIIDNDGQTWDTEQGTFNLNFARDGIIRIETPQIPWADVDPIVAYQHSAMIRTEEICIEKADGTIIQSHGDPIAERGGSRQGCGLGCECR